MSFLKDKYINKATKCFKKAGVVAMSGKFSTNGKSTTAVINYLSKNYAKEGETLIVKRYKKCYLNTNANNHLSELYSSKRSCYGFN